MLPVLGVQNRTDWLIDNAETYARLLQALRGARRSIRIAQLAFDFDCLAYASGAAFDALPRDVVIAETLIARATAGGPGIQILLNASWLLNTARSLRRAFARRGIASERIQVRGFNRFPHFMHAKLVIVDSHEAFLLGSPFVNSYWDDARHAPFDARRPLRELGGRPLHDVSSHLRGPVVRDLEAMFASVWSSAGAGRASTPARRPRAIRSCAAPSTPGTRIVCDAPDGVLPELAAGSTMMLRELLDAIASARSFIYVEHQYLTSRPIVAALAAALRREPALEIIIVLNQNPDLTAYRGWQNERLAEHRLLLHPRVGVFALWSVDEHPEHAGVARINQLFIHSKVIVIDDRWAAVGTSNLDGVSMGDYGEDFAGSLCRRIFRGVRNVEVNVVMDAGDDDMNEIRVLRERLWLEHVGAPAHASGGGLLAAWFAAARENVRMLAGGDDGSDATPARRMIGHLLPYSERAEPREQLADLGIRVNPHELVLCYNPGWIEVHAAVHWIRNIF
jgi:phosphatidylserine/phosphatidylglycerophosphate/cardiolipin synthase-like enzyme